MAGSIGRIKQRHILCFLAIIREGGIGAASEQLNLSQAAVSRTLADLEEILGSRLMERSRAGIVLTPAGEALKRYASASLAALEQGVREVSRQRAEERQAIQIGALPNVAAAILPAAIAIFRGQFPEVPIIVSTGTNRRLMDELRQGDLDIVVGRLAAPEDMEGLHFEPLYQEELSAVVRRGHPVSTSPGVAEIVRAFDQYPVILPQRGTIIRNAAVQLAISIGAQLPSGVIETVSVALGRSLVRRLDAIWLTPFGVAAQDIEDGNFWRLPLDTAASRGDVGITSRRGYPLSPLPVHFVRCLRSVADT